MPRRAQDFYVIRSSGQRPEPEYELAYHPGCGDFMPRPVRGSATDDPAVAKWLNEMEHIVAMKALTERQAEEARLVALQAEREALAAQARRIEERRRAEMEAEEAVRIAALAFVPPTPKPLRPPSTGAPPPLRRKPTP